MSPAPAVILASALVYGATFMGVPAAVTALMRDRTPPGDWTATLAFLTTLFAAGQTAGPWIAGILADRTSTGATVAWTAILCAVAAVIAATERRAYPVPQATAAGPPPAARDTAAESGDLDHPPSGPATRNSARPREKP